MMVKRPKTNAIERRSPLFEHLQLRCIYARRDLTIFAAWLGLAEKKPDFTKEPPDQLRLVIDVPGAAEHQEFAEMLSVLNRAFEVLDVVGSPDYHPRFELTGNDEWLITSALGEFDDLCAQRAARESRYRYTKGLNDAKGRAKGGATMATRAQEHTAHIQNAVADILTNKQTFDWKNGKVADFLMAPERNFQSYKGQVRSRRTMIRYIEAVRTDLKAKT